MSKNLNFEDVLNPKRMVLEEVTKMFTNKERNYINSNTDEFCAHDWLVETLWDRIEKDPNSIGDLKFRIKRSK